MKNTKNKKRSEETCFLSVMSDSLGVDLKDPEKLEGLREDLRFARRMRKLTDHGKLTLVGLLITGILYALWEGTLSLFRKSNG